jgi:uncharacterized linocin/CFP29 family protein
VNLGREAMAWSADSWQRLDQAVLHEMHRASVAAAILPLVGPYPDAQTVPADAIASDRLTVDEAAVLPLVELSVELSLTTTQIAAGGDASTVVTLVTRAANLLAQAEDFVIFQGQTDVERRGLLQLVRQRGDGGVGLVAAATDDVMVQPAAGGGYGERTVAAVVEAYSRLQGRGHPGPYVIALHDEPYADAFSPLPGTLVTPADRIRPLATGGFVGSGALPAQRGIVASVGGGTLDLVVGLDATTAFARVDEDGLNYFRVFERFALRIKDATALVRLVFE